MKKYLDLTGLEYLTARLDDKFAAKSELTGGVFVPDIEIRTQSLGETRGLIEFRFTNADFAALSNIAEQCRVGLVRLKKTSRRNSYTGLKKYSGKKWCMIDDGSSYFNPQYESGDAVDIEDTRTNRVFWTQTAILPIPLQKIIFIPNPDTEPVASPYDWHTFKYDKQMLFDRLVYFRTVSYQANGNLKFTLLNAKTFLSSSDNVAKVMGEFHALQKRIRTVVEGNVTSNIFRCSIPLGIAVMRTVNGKQYLGNTARFFLDISLSRKVDTITTSNPIVNYYFSTGIRLMNNTKMK